jgi:hypothetical protein
LLGGGPPPTCWQRRQGRGLWCGGALRRAGSSGPRRPSRPAQSLSWRTPCT